MAQLWNLRVRSIQYPLQKQKKDAFVKKMGKGFTKETEFRAVMVEWSRASLIRSSHAQGQGFKSRSSRKVFSFRNAAIRTFRELFCKFPDFSAGETFKVDWSEMGRWNTLQQGISHTLELDWNGQMELLQLAASHTLERSFFHGFLPWLPTPKWTDGWLSSKGIPIL